MSNFEEAIDNKRLEKDLEISVEPIDTGVTNAIKRLGLRLDEDGFIRWKSNNPDHPRNWDIYRKAFDTALIFMLDLFTTAVSTAGLSVAQSAETEYELSRTVAILAFGSTYQFGQAFGGVIFPPYSEAFGRKFVYISSSLVYCIACIIVGVTPSVAGAIVGRFVSGFMSAVPSVIVSGSIEDMYNRKQRVWLMFIWACATTLGLLIGPVYGTYISAAIGWRWVFHIASIITCVFTVLLTFIHESRPSLLLSHRLSLLHQTTSQTHFRIHNPDHTPNLQTFAKTALIRPIRLFFTEPIVFLVSLMSAIVWSLTYLFTISLPQIYNHSSLTPQQTTLLFLIIALGLPLGILPRILDLRLISKHHRTSTPLTPEDKLTGFAFAAPSLAFGLWWLALTTPPASILPWYAAIPGLLAIGFAINEVAGTLAGYLADTYTIYTSSALAALAFLRAVLAGCFPLVGGRMFGELGNNWALVVLACVATVFCATPVLFIRFGRRIRQRSEFAKYSLRVNLETQIEDI